MSTPVLTATPRSLAWASVSPTDPISGSVNVTRGTAVYSAAWCSWPRMSATTMPAWYIDMCVKAPWPVTSPRAQSPGPARMCSSTGTARCASSIPTAAGADAGQVGPPARAHEQLGRAELLAVGQGDREAVTVVGHAARRSRRSARRCPPGRTLSPAAPRPPAPRAAAAGPAASTTVTRAPKREKARASSDPIAPPPSTISDSGTCSVSMIWWLVQYGVLARPGTGGIAGVVPVAITIPRVARQQVVANRHPARRGDRAVPAEQHAAQAGEPVGRRRVVPVVGGLGPDPLRDRRPVGAALADAPAMPGIRRPSASRSAARIIIFDGTQPQYGHSPPTSLASTPATRRPAWASCPAVYSPPGPRPMTTTSTSCSLTRDLPRRGACSRVSNRDSAHPSAWLARRVTLAQPRRSCRTETASSRSERTSSSITACAVDRAAAEQVDRDEILLRPGVNAQVRLGQDEHQRDRAVREAHVACVQHVPAAGRDRRDGELGQLRRRRPPARTA